MSRDGDLVKAGVREFFLDLKNSKHNDPNLKRALKLGKRRYKGLNNDTAEPPPLKRKVYQMYAKQCMTGLLI